MFFQLKQKQHHLKGSLKHSLLDLTHRTLIQQGSCGPEAASSDIQPGHTDATVPGTNFKNHCSASEVLRT